MLEKIRLDIMLKVVRSSKLSKDLTRTSYIQKEVTKAIKMQSVFARLDIEQSYLNETIR